MAYQGDQWAAGGGSGNDWAMGGGVVPGYVINGDGEVWTLPAAGASDQSVRTSNFTFVNYKNNMLGACDW